jgi:hypothetical protein
MTAIISPLAGTVPVVQRLALAIQPVDAATTVPVTDGLRVGRETPQALVAARRSKAGRVDPMNPIPTRGSGFVLRHGGDIRDREIIRIVDPRRRYVPRRFSVPIWSASRLAENDSDDAQSAYITTDHRLLRPWLLPGPAFRPPSGVTGSLIRVLRPDRKPVPWARAIAFDEAGARVGWAHGDELGQLFLLVPKAAWPPPEPAVFDIAVRVFARASVPPVIAPSAPSGSDFVPLDPLSSLPVEAIPDPTDPPGPPVLISNLLRGLVPPPDYVAAAQDEVVRLTYGLTVVPSPIVFNPAP